MGMGRGSGSKGLTMFVWLRLPEKVDGIVVDTLDLLQYARREGVDFSPGYLYAGASIEGKKISDCSLRLCFTELDEAAIENGIITTLIISNRIKQWHRKDQDKKLYAG